MKETIHRDLKNKREKLSQNEVLEDSNKIKNRLFEMKEFKQSSYLLFYSSYDNEVYTHDMIKECLKNKKKIFN